MAQGGKMSKMAELHAQKELLVIEIKYEDCELTGYRKYNFDEMRTQFDKKIDELEVDAEMRQEGWNDKQRDYAMDNMTNENLSLNDEREDQ